ncbi:MAG: hypothetical protein V8R08_02700 [Coriobacteriales bacterium]
MNRISAWLYNFMQGRYGFDQLGQALSVGVAVMWIFSILCGVLANMLRLVWIAWLSTALNWIGLILLVLMIFRVLSRNKDARRAENEAFLRRRRRRSERKNASAKDISSKGKGKANAKDEVGYKYLSCSFCGQQMRVPAGKGKIAVKCPSCGEKTIVQS